MMLTINSAFAAKPDQSSSAIADGFNKFVNKIDSLTTAGVQQPDFVEFVDYLFLSLATILCILTMYKWSFGATGLVDIFTTVILILMVKSLMVGYLDGMAALWNIATGVAGSIQKGMVGTDDLFFAPKFLSKVMENVTFSGGSWTAPFKAMKGALIVFVSSGLMLLLSMLSYISAVWGLWGFQLAKLIGLLFFPSLLFEKISFLFDGWLRFTWGFIIYYIIARLNVVMVACSLALYLGVGIPPSQSIGPIEFPSVESVFEVFGLLTFTLVGILALFSTGKFAGTIVSGAGGGGMGSAVLGAARVAGKLAAG